MKKHISSIFLLIFCCANAQTTKDSLLLALIKKYSKKDGLSIAYNDKVVLPISKEKKEEFEELVQINNILS
jgi:hypothetical protein